MAAKKKVVYTDPATWPALRTIDGKEIVPGPSYAIRRHHDKNFREVVCVAVNLRSRFWIAQSRVDGREIKVKVSGTDAGFETYSTVAAGRRHLRTQAIRRAEEDVKREQRELERSRANLEKARKRLREARAARPA